MKTLDKIPTTKIQRASKIMSTGVKVGGNYLKYYGKKLVNSETTKDELNESNAEDIYDSLKSLKGSALKVAQMLSMEKNILPKAYVDKFSLSQFQVPPLSAALVRKTFKHYFGDTPESLFDSFDAHSVAAASIGQVHKATKDGKQLAVKIQYPGVAESISSDLRMVKPIAIKMFNIKGKDSDKYFKEVENKLLEETDYLREVAQSKEITNACRHIPNLKFPMYYEELSGERIITMDWMTGVHLSEFTKINTDQFKANRLGQTLWDFYMFQIHHLRKVHADPHPGNFLVDENANLIAIDFGCIKVIPNDFYIPYFELANPENIDNPETFSRRMYDLEILKDHDTKEELAFFGEMFKEMLRLLTKPFHDDEFDFSGREFLDEIGELSTKYAQATELRKMNGNRGSEHFLYINRTFFGLYSLMHDLGAKVKINNYLKYT